MHPGYDHGFDDAMADSLERWFVVYRWSEDGRSVALSEHSSAAAAMEKVARCQADYGGDRTLFYWVSETRQFLGWDA